MFRRHCSDAQLLAHLDAELCGWSRARVEAHLESCWGCRRRQDSLERQAHSASAVFQDHDLFGPTWVERAKARFVQRRRQHDTLAGLPAATPPKRRLLVATAVTALLCIGVLAGWLHQRTAARVDVPELLERIRRAETSLERQSLHQVFRIEVTAVRATPAHRSARIEVWSDRIEKRFASKWMENGVLHYGAWRPAAGREVVHDPSPSSPSERLIRLDASSLDPALVEERVLGWFKARRWRPIAFAEEVAMFLSEDRVLVEARRFRSAGGRSIVRLTAWRKAPPLAAGLTFEVDAETHWPRLCRVHLESRDRALELVLVAESVTVLTPAELTAASFEPDIPAPASPPQPRPRTITKLPPPMPSVWGIDVGGLAVEAHYALHRVGACLGEGIDVVVQPEGRVVIRGLLETPERKEEITAALRTLESVDVELRTIAEVVRNQTDAFDSAAPASIPPDIQMPASRLAVEEALQRYLAGRVQASVPGELVQFANQVVADSSVIASHGWALRKLAEAFPARVTNDLGRSAAWLLEAMVLDHASELETAIGAARTRLAPFLQAVVGDAPKPEADVWTGSADWRRACFALQVRTEKIGRLTRALFTASGQTALQPSVLAAQLLEALEALSPPARELAVLQRTLTRMIPERQERVDP